VVAASAATLVVASGAGVLATGAQRSGGDPVSAAAVAEAAPYAGELPARAELRAPQSPAPSLTTPAATGSPSTAPAPSATSTAAPDPDLSRTPPAKTAAPKVPASRVLKHDYQAQTTYFYCGPAAVRHALSTLGVDRSQDDLAVRLGTTVYGTNSASDTTRVLNQLVSGDPYRTRMIPGQAATDAQTERLRTDLVATIADGRGVVANVAGSVTDLAGGWHSFPGGHYVALVGYRDGGRSVQVADSANPASASYWVSVEALADWIATRGYSA
jgi:hypothetical protein